MHIGRSSFGGSKFFSKKAAEIARNQARYADILAHIEYAISTAFLTLKEMPTSPGTLHMEGLLFPLFDIYPKAAERIPDEDLERTKEMRYVVRQQQIDNRINNVINHFHPEEAGIWKRTTHYSMIGIMSLPGTCLRTGDGALLISAVRDLAVLSRSVTSRAYISLLQLLSMLPVNSWVEEDFVYHQDSFHDIVQLLYQMIDHPTPVISRNSEQICRGLIEYLNKQYWVFDDYEMYLGFLYDRISFVMTVLHMIQIASNCDLYRQSECGQDFMRLSTAFKKSARQLIQWKMTNASHV